jgi:hypothetical protein
MEAAIKIKKKYSAYRQRCFIMAMLRIVMFTISILKRLSGKRIKCGSATHLNIDKTVTSFVEVIYSCVQLVQVAKFIV